jgi:hypothetical protein
VTKDAENNTTKLLNLHFSPHIVSATESGRRKLMGHLASMGEMNA